MLTICKLGTVHTLNFAQCFDDSVVNLRAFEPSASRRAEMGRECPGGSRGQRHDCDLWRPGGGRGGGRREASEFMVISELTGGSESCRGQDLENCLLKSVPGAPCPGRNSVSTKESRAGPSAIKVQKKFLVQQQENSRIVITQLGPF